VTPIATARITQRKIDYASDALADAWYGNANRYHLRFEAALAAYRGCAVNFPSGCTFVRYELWGVRDGLMKSLGAARKGE
jgi:hypothetical protein